MTIPAYALRELDKLVCSLRSFEVLMVVTRGRTGELRGRPMVVLDVSDDGAISLVTPRRSSLLEEIEQDPRGLVLGQGPRQFVTLGGTMDVRDSSHARLTKHLSRLRRWLGPSLPSKEQDLVGLTFEPLYGEYWLVPGIKSVRYLFEATRAFLDRQASREDLVEHARICVPSRHPPTPR